LAITTEASETSSSPGPGVGISGIAGLRSVLRVRPFRRLWMVLGVASLGDWIGLLATALFASSQVSSNAAKGAAFGGTIAVRLLPSLVLGPIAGVMADRFDRRYTMVVTDLIRFVFYSSIPLVPLLGFSGSQSVAWAAIATFVGEAVTLIWVPAKEAAVPNLIPKSLIEVSNQLTLITTYGITPIVAALGLSSLTGIAQHSGIVLAHWAEPTQLALWFNGFSRLATALVVFFGIREIGGKTAERARQAQRSMFRQFLDGWTYIGGTPQVRGLVLGIFGAFAGAGVVVGTANVFAVSLGAGPAAFYLLFGTLFIGLAIGIAAGPVIVKELSRKRWFGMSIVLASAAVLVMAVAFHLVVALIGALLVGTGAGMAFLAGTTLLYSEVGDEVRGRVFAVVNIGTRIVLLLAVAVSSTLVGLGSSRRVMLGNVGIDVSSTRVLLLIAGVIGLWAGVAAFRQMDDKRGVPILADLWGSMRGRPRSSSAAACSWSSRAARARASRPRSAASQRRWRPRAATWSSPGSRARPTSARASAACSSTRNRLRRPEPRPCSTRPTAPTTSRRWSARPWPVAPWSSATATSTPPWPTRAPVAPCRSRRSPGCRPGRPAASSPTWSSCSTSTPGWA
jgi:dTMP kinase